MNSSMDASDNPFLCNKIENLCIICRKVLTCQYASVQDILPRITPQINLIDALKLLTDFAQLNINAETLRTCTTCFSKVQQIIQFYKECNQSAEYIRAYINQPKPVKTEAFEHEDIDTNEDSLDEEAKNMVCAVYNEGNEGPSSKLEDVDAESSESLPQEKRSRSLINRSMKKECPHCHKMYRNDYMRIHIRTHTGELPYHCKLCDKRFSNRTSLTTHILVHEDKREFLCTCCGGSFRLRSDLNIHMRTHTGERPYECEICGKAFHTSKTRKSHMTTHSDEKPFACSQCPKKFSLKKFLKQHKVVHAEIKPIECTFCGRRFTQRHVLRTHQAKSCPGKNVY